MPRRNAILILILPIRGILLNILVSFGHVFFCEYSVALAIAFGLTQVRMFRSYSLILS